MYLFMDVMQLLDELITCNKKATVSCIMQPEENSSFYDTKAIRTALDNNRVIILVMSMNDEGMTVQTLINELKDYGKTLPVFIEENRLRRPHRLVKLLGIEKQDKIVWLRIPQKMADFIDS